MAKKGLGKGLDSLIPPDNKRKQKSASPAPEQSEQEILDASIRVDINKVEPNRQQPRQKFDEEALAELSESIRQYGVLSPLLVQKRKDYYEIIAGERRWRAARQAGLTEIPVIIRELTDQEIFEISLIENIQREQLNPIEEAMAYKRLLEEFSLKQEDVAKRISKSRTAITNAMRLLKLDERVQQMLIDEQISTGHARAILGIEDGDEQYRFACRIVDEKLNVRQVEKAIRQLPKEKASQNPMRMDEKLDAVYAQAEEHLKDILGAKVRIHVKERDRGSVEIEYYSEEQLQEILDKLEA